MTYSDLYSKIIVLGAGWEKDYKKHEWKQGFQLGGHCDCPAERGWKLEAGINER